MDENQKRLSVYRARDLITIAIGSVLLVTAGIGAFELGRWIG